MLPGTCSEPSSDLSKLGGIAFFAEDQPDFFLLTARAEAGVSSAYNPKLVPMFDEDFPRLCTFMNGPV